MQATAEDARTLILQTAEQLFVQQGFDKTSMKELARHAGVSLTTLYSYFDGKTAILRALAEPRFTAFCRSLHSAGRREQDEVERILSTLTMACATIADDPLLSSLFRHRLADRNLSDLMETVVKLSEARANALCADLKQRGRMQCEDVPALIGLIRCAIEGWFAFEQSRNHRIPIERMVEALAGLIRTATR